MNDALPTGPLVLPPALAADLTRRYSEPHRAYHDLTHLHELAAWFHTLAEEPGWAQPAEVWAALLWHDAVYVPGQPDNEARSAALARASDLPIDLDRVAHLIGLTAHHGADGDDPDPEAALFLDMDMAILGAPNDRFDAYDAGVAGEFSAIPAPLYRAGRRAFLARVLETPRIFRTEHFHAHLDAQARANLQRAIERHDAVL